MTTGMPSACAPDEPQPGHARSARCRPPAAPRVAASSSTSAYARATRSRGTFSPKNTTSGFSTPPHAVHSATPEAARPRRARRRRPGRLDRGPAASIAGVELGQPRVQLARGAQPAAAEADAPPSMRPCRSITRRLPARRCRPSTFCVITPRQHARALEGGERPVAGVRHGARPCAPSRRGCAPSSAAAPPGRRRTPGTSSASAAGEPRAAVVRDAGVGRQARAGEARRAAGRRGASRAVSSASVARPRGRGHPVPAYGRSRSLPFRPSATLGPPWPRGGGSASRLSAERLSSSTARERWTAGRPGIRRGCPRRSRWRGTARRGAPTGPGNGRRVAGRPSTSLGGCAAQGEVGRRGLGRSPAAMPPVPRAGHPRGCPVLPPERADPRTAGARGPVCRAGAAAPSGAGRDERQPHADRRRLGLARLGRRGIQRQRAVRGGRRAPWRGHAGTGSVPGDPGWCSRYRRA